MTLALVMLQIYVLGLQAKVHLGCYAVRVLSAPHLYEGCLQLSLISLHATVSPHARQELRRSIPQACSRLGVVTFVTPGQRKAGIAMLP